MNFRPTLTSSLLPILALALAYYPQSGYSANILVYGIIGSHSTRLTMWPFMEALADKGHNVTYLSPFASFEESEKNSKVKAFIPKKWLQVLGSWDKQMGFYDIRKNNMLPLMWYGLRHMGVLSCESLYGDEEFLEWIKISPKFDLVIAEASANECAYGLVRLWNAKLSIYSATTTLPWMMDQYGFPDESSSISDTILNYQMWEEMTFAQRFINAMCPLIFGLTWEYEYLPKLEEITRKGLGLEKEQSEQLPGFMDVGRSASLVYLSTHFSIDFPRSLPPHVVEIGGAVQTKKKKPLSKELEGFINFSKKGFIYIAFGTVADFSTFDELVKQEFINALSHFPSINFVWASSSKINETLPRNIFVSKWTPQQTILAHPKIKAFITHSGMGSTTESILHSVPLVCIPVLAEQDLNANAIVSRGAGIKLEITTLKEHQLKNAISEVLNNPIYRNGMNKLTAIFNDRPKPPLENAVWWTEYILRHENVNSFLVPLSAKQSWWKRRQIDVWITATLLIISSTLITAYFSFAILRKLLFAMIRKESNSPEKTTKKIKTN